MLAFFRTFTDTCHHGTEEGYLFPALEAIGVSRRKRPPGLREEIGWLKRRRRGMAPAFPP
jgi:hemerythrin-like domain-containing protein